MPAAGSSLVQIDPDQFEEALLELGQNARDAMPEGGTLSLSTAILDGTGADGPPVTVKPGRYVVVGVADTGAGMDATTLGQACDPLFTTKDTGSHVGLGLCEVFRLARRLEGCLTLTSEPHRGTAARIYLPCVAVTA